MIKISDSGQPLYLLSQATEFKSIFGWLEVIRISNVKYPILKPKLVNLKSDPVKLLVKI